MMLALSLAFVVGAASEPAKDVDLKVRVIYGHNKSTVADPLLKDLEGALKDLKFTAYELRDQTSLKVVVGGPEAQYTTPSKRHLHVSATETKKKGKIEQVRVLLEIPELKFKTSAWISPGATLVVGGPKYEDGVLLFALGASK